MATLAGTTWQFVPTTYGAFLTFNATFNAGGTMSAIISSVPWAPGVVIKFTGTWTEGKSQVSFTFHMSNDAGEVLGSGTHQQGNGSGTLYLVIGANESPALSFAMMKV